MTLRVFALGVLSIAAGWGQTPAGRWDGSVTVGGFTAPFRIDFAGDGTTLTGALVNGGRRIVSEPGRFDAGRVRLSCRQAGVTLDATVTDGGMKGTFTRAGAASMPFSASAYCTCSLEGEAGPNLTGTWASAETDWRLVLRREGEDTLATMVRGDTQLGPLSGRFDGLSFNLHYFDGVQAALAEIEPRPNGALDLKFSEPERPARKLRMIRAAAAVAQSDGWIPLFDGATLNGWRVAAKPDDADHTYWTVQDGAITCDSRRRPKHDYVWLISTREFADFDLKLKVRSFRESPGNTGVQVRSRYDQDSFWLDGPQVDIHPPGPFRSGLIYDETRGVRRWVFPSLPGSAITPEQGAAKWVWRHADEGDGWNDVLIECHGTRIRTTVNGIPIADYNGAGALDDDLHMRRNVGVRGYIALQLHTGDDLHVQFKDIYVKPAPERQPPVVDPGAGAKPPSDAIVLFDGKDLSEWATSDGSLTGWAVRDGAILTTARRASPEQRRSWDLLSRRKFGSAQIHLEYNIPPMPTMKDQARGNSGVYLQGRYEIQVLDSYNNPTYPHGSNAALYGYFPPLVNASRPPGEWQSYDIVFHAPRCDAQGKLAEPGRLTLIHNGVLVQDHVPVTPRRGCNPEPGPLLLQDHYHPDVAETPMRFRNIWVRPLP